MNEYHAVFRNLKTERSLPRTPWRPPNKTAWLSEVLLGIAFACVTALLMVVSIGWRW